MMAPCYDASGKLRGIVQLFNKKNTEPISVQDEKELQNLTPLVAEMIKQADEIKYIGDVVQNMSLHLSLTKQKMLESTRIFEERDVASIHTALGQVHSRMDGYMQKRRQNVLKESQLAHQVFSVIREEEAVAA